jgi:hypothetical protein
MPKSCVGARNCRCVPAVVFPQDHGLRCVLLFLRSLPLQENVGCLARKGFTDSVSTFPYRRFDKNSHAATPTLALRQQWLDRSQPHLNRFRRSTHAIGAFPNALHHDTIIETTK